jgi:hypothetical protein
MAKDKKHWMAEAFAGSRGQLRKKTRTKKGHNISERELTRKANSRNLKTKRQAVLARTARRINERRGRQG